MHIVRIVYTYAIINEESNEKERIEFLEESAFITVSQTRKICDAMWKMSPLCNIRHDIEKHLQSCMYNLNATLEIDYLAKSISKSHRICSKSFYSL